VVLTRSRKSRSSAGRWFSWQDGAGGEVECLVVARSESEYSG
jgi:hypothetical protein